MEIVGIIGVLLVVTVVLSLYLYGTRNAGKLEKLGIPVIKPYPFVGSVPRPWTLMMAEEDMKNAKRYGKVWGQYVGREPTVFITDKEMAKRILIKDFEYFSDRPELFDIELGRDMLDLLKGEKWKTVRSVLSAALASGVKLKGAFQTTVECTKNACKRLDNKIREDSVIRVKDQLYGPLVLDIMAKFSFGLDVPNIDDTESAFVKAASAFGAFQTPVSPISALFIAFPSLANMMLAKSLVPQMKYTMELLRHNIKQRRAEGIVRHDLVDTLIDAIDNKVPTKEYQDLQIDEQIILVQGAEMLMAAYDTTGTTLTITSYFLAKHPDVVDRLLAEIEDIGELTYESVQKMPLMDAVLQEALRLASIITRHLRVCTKDWQYEGLRIPVGMQVSIPTHPFHFDPEVFPDPDRFLPDRWLGEGGRQLTQYNWIPFGLGPRACIGQRLALMECKYILSYVLQKYKLSATDKTKLEFLKGQDFFAAMEPIYIKFEVRE